MNLALRLNICNIKNTKLWENYLKPSCRQCSSCPHSRQHTCSSIDQTSSSNSSLGILTRLRAPQILLREMCMGHARQSNSLRSSIAGSRLSSASSRKHHSSELTRSILKESARSGRSSDSATITSAPCVSAMKKTCPTSGRRRLKTLSRWISNIK